MTQLTRILFVVPLIASLGPMTIQPLWASAPSTPQASWNNLGNLARGDVVKVVVSRGSAQRGVFQSVTGDTMVVHFPTGDQTFERQTVTQVLVKREGRRGRHVLIGLLVEQVWDWARRRTCHPIPDDAVARFRRHRP